MQTIFKGFHKMDKKKYITTPIYYVNDNPHIGHTYTTLACDVWARFYRLKGEDVFFLTGTDEHGQKVQKAAESKGIDPQSFTDAVSQNFRDLCQKMNFSNNDFIRTTESRHKKAAQYLWQILEDKGEIYLGKYAGWYALRDEAYYLESELIDGKAPTGAEVEWMEEESFFFRLSKWQEPLLEFYKSHPDFVWPKTRYNEVIRFVEGGLKDLSVSRTSFNWGVPIPHHEKHVMYVWIEALTNYLTGVGYPDEKYKAYWPADVHIVGKDILRFHAVYWPAFLLAAGIDLPRRVFAHGWWTVEGEKMSKSLGNFISPDELVSQYGLDQVRYFLMREIPFGNDGDFSKQAIITRNNAELANDLGNLIQRVLTQVYKNCQEQIPSFEKKNIADEVLLKEGRLLLEKLSTHFEEQAFHKALDEIWKIIIAANKYIDDQAPWVLKKTDPNRMEAVLYTLCEMIRIICICLQPFMPEKMKQVLDILNIPKNQRDFKAIEEKPLSPGHKIQEPKPIFPRIEE